MLLDYKDFQDYMRDVVDYMTYWDKEAYTDFRFVALDQWDEANKERLQEEKRPFLVLDKTRIIIDSVSGNEIVNRFESKFYPRNLPGEDIDLEASEVISQLYKWIRQEGDVDHQESYMFRDMLVCGVGCMDTYMDYTDNPDGRIVSKRVPVFQFSWDPTSQEPNFQDANSFTRDKWIPEKEFKVRFPEFEGSYKLSGDIRENRILQRMWDRVTNRDTHSYNSSRSFDYFDPRKKHVHVWEHQWRELKPVTRILIPNAAGSFDEVIVPRDEKDDTLQEVSEMTRALVEQAAQAQAEVQQDVQWQDFEQYKYFKAIIGGKEILHEEEEQLGRFTLQATTALEDWSRGDRKYYFGLMKPMRDPQRYVNTFFSQAVHMWSTSPKGALMHEPNFFSDEEEAHKKLAQPNPTIRLQHGALSGTARDKYAILDNARSFAGTEPLFHFAQNAISDASGVNTSYTAGLATDVRRAATSAINAVNQSNLTTLSVFFDSHKRHLKDYADLALKFAKLYLPEDKVARILGPTKAQLVQFTKDDLVQDYDIIVGEGPTSPNSQMEVLDKLVQTDLLGRLMDSNLWPAEGWKYAGLPSDLGTQIMQRQQQLEQMQQQQTQAPPPAV